MPNWLRRFLIRKLSEGMKVKIKDKSYTVDDGDGLLKKTLVNLAQTQKGSITVDQLFDILLNRHNFTFTTFYQSTKKITRRKVL